MATYYKYRDFTNIVRLSDILLRNRLFACSHNMLNDPMEGKFLYSGNSKDYKKRIKEKLDNTLICSLSTSCDNGLLWTHYANQHTGCCIEVEVTATSWRMQDVHYPETLPNINETNSSKDNAVIDAILFQKSKDWSYEKEIRCIKEKGKNISPYLTIHVKRVLLGIKIDKADKSFIKSFVNAINKGRKDADKIEIHQMTRSEIDFGYV